MVDWGNVPAWVAAIVSFLAWGTAVGAAAIAYRAWRLNTETSRTAQAMKIASWVEGSTSFELVVTNVSDLPAYDIHAQVDGFGELFARGVQRSNIAVLPPGATVRVPFILENALKSRNPSVFLGEIDERGTNSGDFRVRLEFADASGIAWERDYDGGLSVASKGRKRVWE